MPPARGTRSARTGEIPRHFIVNWHKSDSRSGPKPSPLVRRPITACEHCHAAKVRCNGQRDCQRCVARHLVCTYPHSAVRPGALQLGPSSQAGRDPSSSPPTSGASHVSRAPVPSQHLPPLVDMAPTAACTAAPDYMGIAPVPGVYEPDTSMASVMPLGWGDTLPSAPAPLDSDLTPYVGDTMTQHSAYLHDSYGHLFADAIGGGRPGTESATTSPTALGQQTGLQGLCQDAAPCPCRPNLMIWVSKVARAMQDKRPDEILKVTGEVARYCQDVVDCKTEESRCSDLLLIMSVLQETRPCFDLIAKSGFLQGQGGDTAVKICFGDYEVALDNTGVRAMLAMDLVQRAAAVVTSISNRAQCMINELAEPCNLAKANIAYLEANIGHFKSILACVVRHIDEAVNMDGSGLNVSDLLSRNTSECQAEGRASS